MSLLDICLKIKQFIKPEVPIGGYCFVLYIVIPFRKINSMSRLLKKAFPPALLCFFLLAFNSISCYANPGIGIKKTFVLGKDQFPDRLKKYNASKIYLLYSGGAVSQTGSAFFKGDTITNLSKFLEYYSYGTTGYRLIYENIDKTDSALQTDLKFRIRYKAYNLDNNLLQLQEYDSVMKMTDQFILNYGEKLLENTTRGRSNGNTEKTLEWLLRQYEVYNSYDRNNYALSSVWILSIGIDDYGPIKYRTCKTDAQSYADFFKNQYSRNKPSSFINTAIHEYVLLDKDATKDSILAAMREIAKKSTYNDYFIFNFSGCSNDIKNDPVTSGTNFFPYDVTVTTQSTAGAGLQNRNSKDTTNPYKNCISLRTLQEYIQLIPANNQLFISEAGPSPKFKTEFVKTLMQNSPEVASILNKNRVIIVPTGFGMDGVKCQSSTIQKGPINYYITSLDSANIYDLFKDEFYANQVAFKIKNKAYTCRSFDYDYFDIFFERKFLKEYKEIFEGESGQTRGLGLKAKELRDAANFSGKQYALVVGTNNYKGGWKKLPNAINDARSIRDELTNDYGFEVRLLEDKPMDSIYKALGEYYRIMQPNDQLIIYFAGHGDMETEFLGDGFIVCADSKSRDDDPARNTYIQYAKLQKMVNRIPSRQILVMLDVCHGGLFNQKILEEKRSDPAKTITNRNVRQFLIDQSEFKCRKFLSSVGTDEAFDGKAGDHSPFVILLLQVLRAKGETSNGIVTLSDIFSVLQKNSLNETATLKISPQKDGFGSDNSMSDFILLPVAKNGAKE